MDPTTARPGGWLVSFPGRADWMLGASEDGLGIAARLRARFPRLRTIIMTGYHAAELARPVEAGEVNLLLAKPFSPTALFDAVKRLAGGWWVRRATFRRSPRALRARPVRGG